MDKVGIKEIEQRIMYDVERIREVAQETEHSGLALTGCPIGSAEPKQDGENDDDRDP